MNKQNLWVFIESNFILRDTCNERNFKNSEILFFLLDKDFFKTRQKSTGEKVKNSGFQELLLNLQISTLLFDGWQYVSKCKTYTSDESTISLLNFAKAMMVKYTNK